MLSCVINDFVDVTKHKDSEISDEHKEDFIVKKILATQSPNWKKVYRNVSSDYDSINYRAPNVLKDWKNINFDNLHDLLINQKYDKKILKSFRKVIKEQPKENVLPMYFSKKLYNDGEFIETLVKICGDDIKAGNDLHETLINYSFPESFADISKMIKNFDFRKTLEDVDIHLKTTELKRLNEMKKIKINNFINSDPKELTQKIERKYRKKKAIDDYKIENDLPTQYSSLIVANHVLLNGNKNFIDVVDFYPNESIDDIMETSGAKNFFKDQSVERSMTGMLKRDFVKDLILDIGLDINIINKLKKIKINV